MASQQRSSNCEDSTGVAESQISRSNEECFENPKTFQTLGCEITANSAFRHMMDIKTTIIKLDILAKSRLVQENQLRSAIILSMSPIIDRIRGVTEFLEIHNLKKQFKIKRKKYKAVKIGSKLRPTTV